MFASKRSRRQRLVERGCLLKSVCSTKNFRPVPVRSLRALGDVAFWVGRSGAEPSSDFCFNAVNTGSDPAKIIENTPQIHGRRDGKIDAPKPRDEFVWVDNFHVLNGTEGV